MTRLLAPGALCILIFSHAVATAALAQSSRLFGGQDDTSMRIDLLPDLEVNVIKTRSGRVIPVAILGSATLDVGDINPRTIRLTGMDVMLVGKSDKSLCQRPADINGDGYLDLLCDVRTTGFRVGEGTYSILLEAETYDKESLSGQDKLQIVAN